MAFKDAIRTVIALIIGFAGMTTIFFVSDGIPQWKWSLLITIIFVALYQIFKDEKDITNNTITDDPDKPDKRAGDRRP
jgi:membrane protein YdbS with pleckstrin-like domain